MVPVARGQHLSGPNGAFLRSWNDAAARFSKLLIAACPLLAIDSAYRSRRVLSSNEDFMRICTPIASESKEWRRSEDFTFIQVSFMYKCENINFAPPTFT
jgi:hypothetical protein